MTESENPCRVFFEQYAQHPKKVEILQRTGLAHEWECYSASKHSPGPVQSNERVLRLVINPIHIDPETGDLKPSAVTDVKDKGCSVERLSLTTIEESIATGRIVAAAKNEANQGAPAREIHCVANLSVNDIRNIRVGANTQAFCIFDTALEHNRAHADICQVVSPKGQEARSARSQLFALADKSCIFQSYSGSDSN